MIRLWCFLVVDFVLFLFFVFCFAWEWSLSPTNRCYRQPPLIIWKWNRRWNQIFWFQAICDKIHCNSFFKPLTRGNTPMEVRKCCFKLMPENRGLGITPQKPKWLMKFGRRVLWARVGHLGQQASNSQRQKKRLAWLPHCVQGKSHFLLVFWGRGRGSW